MVHIVVTGGAGFLGARLARAILTSDALGVAGAPARPADMRPDEVYVRVPIETTHLGSEKLFEEVIVLVLRRDDGRYKVSAYGETSN